ncbi:hypothetical protein HK405_003470 [Cladochytrium tenue]|nr:hypothetical protein HK405_003470 [Cladochytrium tenue]
MSRATPTLGPTQKSTKSDPDRHRRRLLNPTRAQLAALARSATAASRDPDTDKRLCMVNLLRFRRPDGAAAYAAYARAVAPLLASVGAHVVWAGDVAAGCPFVIPPPSLPGTSASPDADAAYTWDRVVVVEYPSAAAFLEMIGGEGYRGRVNALREDALERLLLVPTTPVDEGREFGRLAVKL